MKSRALSVAELAEELGGRVVRGDGETRIDGLAQLSSAGPSDLCFARSRRFWLEAGEPEAGAVLVPEDLNLNGPVEIVSPNPSLDFARAASLLLPSPPRPEGIHPSAVIHETTVLGADVSIGAGCVVGAGCRIGDGCVLRANVTLYEEVTLGAGCEIHASCVLRERVILGERVLLHPGVVLGADGFGYEFAEDGRLEKVPQVGNVSIGDDAEIGANTTIDRARVGTTRIGARCKIDNLVQIAHNCQIGDDSVVVAQTGIAGGARVGRGVAVMAQAGLEGDARVGDGAVVGGRAGVMGEIKPGARVFGTPAVEGRVWLKSVTLSRRLPEMLRRLRALEKRVNGNDATPGDEPEP